MTEFNLTIGMKKRDVYHVVKQLGLGKDIKDSVKEFFKKDLDKVVSNENEISILHSIMDGTGKVKMPNLQGWYKYPGELPNSIMYRDSDKYSSTIETFSTNGKHRTVDTMYDYNGDGYADVRVLDRYKARKNSFPVHKQDRQVLSNYFE